MASPRDTRDGTSMVTQPSRQGVYSAVAGAIFGESPEPTAESRSQKRHRALGPPLSALGCATMITLTKLNGTPFVMNAEKIRTVEKTPDTLICCDNGERLMVKEEMSEVLRRAIEYARIIRKPITD